MLLEATKARAASVAPAPAHKKPVAPADTVSMTGVADALNKATRGIDVCYTHLPIGWSGANSTFRHPLDYLGAEGGAGVGSGPGIVVGAALGLKGSGRLPIGVLGDGDFLMANTAVWTATHYQIPCLFVVCNNRSFFNDELHQERVAKERSRPVENRWIGMRIGDPDIDLAAMGRSMGAVGIGPATCSRRSTRASRPCRKAASPWWTRACCPATTPKARRKRCQEPFPNAFPCC
jgi:thiamine pyrophosphate-dependent acetolactate synthase large subunit-like protein